jgi:hypothetical protein
MANAYNNITNLARYCQKKMYLPLHHAFPVKVYERTFSNAVVFAGTKQKDAG